MTEDEYVGRVMGERAPERQVKQLRERARERDRERERGGKDLLSTAA